MLAASAAMLACSIVGCSQDDDQAEEAVAIKQETEMAKKTEGIDSILVSIVSDKSQDAKAIDITYDLNSGNIDMTYYNEMPKGMEATTATTRTAGNGWHYGGHATGAASALIVGNNIRKKIKTAKKVNITLISDGNGGFYVYWKKVK